jgi:hypothetical protein
VTASATNVRQMQAIIDRLRRMDCDVRLFPGWETRGRSWSFTPRGIVDHHDASTVKAGEWGALGWIMDGSPIAPLSQFQVPRCAAGVPTVGIVAAGGCNHAGKGGPYRDVPRDAGNRLFYGAEKANSGREPYTDAADFASDMLFAAVLEVVS